MKWLDQEIKFIVVIGILFVFFFAFNFLLKYELLKYKEPFSQIETIDTPAILREIEELNQTTIPLTPIQSIFDQEKSRNQSFPISHFCIKSVYNAPCSGNYVSSQAVINYIQRGCRWLDIEIYLRPNLNNDGSTTYSLCAGSNSGTDYISTSYNQEPVKIADIADALLSVAGTETSDPIFVFFRVRAQPADFSECARILKEEVLLKNRENSKYDAHITPETPISLLKGKLLFGIEQKMSNYSDLYSYINFVVPEEGWQLISDTDIELTKKQPSSSTLTLDELNKTRSIRIVTPTKDQNIDIIRAIHFLGCQIVPMNYRFGGKDRHLVEAETLFSQYKMGFIPLSAAIVSGEINS